MDFRLTSPGPSYRLKLGDLLYVMCEETSWTEAQGLNEEEGRQIKKTENKTVSFFLDFDEFNFPDCFHNCIVGPQFMTKDMPGSPGSINLRDRFKINLAGVRKKNGEVICPAGPKTYVEKGDVGLVIRVPDKETGRSRSTLQDEQLRRLFEGGPEVPEPLTGQETSADLSVRRRVPMGLLVVMGLGGIAVTILAALRLKKVFSKR